MSIEEDLSDTDTTTTEASRQRHYEDDHHDMFRSYEDEESDYDAYADANTYVRSYNEFDEYGEPMLPSDDDDDSYDGFMPYSTGPY